MRLILLLLLITLFNSTLRAQNYYYATPQGYGASVTGGGNATPVVVSSFTALRNALQSTSTANAVIIVSGTIDCSYMSITMNNKTLLGLPGARLRNNQITIGSSTTSASNSGILNIKTGSNNVIIRNIIFEGPGAYDVDGRDNLTNEGTNVWIDHCEFQDGMDGNFDIKGTADNVTVSWCKFTYLKPAIPGGSGGSNDHRFSNLVGSSSTDAPADGHYSITFQNCFWGSGCKDRMPRARNAQLHLLNCYFNVNVTGSKAIGLGGGVNNTTCYVQNSHFANVGTVYSTATADGGTVAIAFSNCLNGASTIGTVAAPSYTSTVMPVNEVANYLSDATCGAGATLQVSTSGEIRPSDCSFLSTNQWDKEAVVTFYPTLVQDKIQIELASGLSKPLELTIVSIHGQVVHVPQRTSNGSIELDVEKLARGIYLCRLAWDTTVVVKKFIKL